MKYKVGILNSHAFFECFEMFECDRLCVSVSNDFIAYGYLYKYAFINMSMYFYYFWLHFCYYRNENCLREFHFFNPHIF